VYYGNITLVKLIRTLYIIAFMRAYHK